MNIVLNGPVAHAGAAILRSRFGPAAAIAEVDHRAADDRALRAFAEAEVLVSVDFNARLPPTPRLRLVHVPAAGLDALDLGAVPDGCRVCNVFEHEIGISEYVVAALLHLTVDLAGRSVRFKAGSWAESPRLAAPFRPELAGRTLGSIGYGHIGRAVARRAQAFGMRVMALARTRREVDPRPDWLGDPGQLPILLGASDFVVVACPLNEATRGMIGAAALARMKPDAVLINVARGPIVDDDALYQALSTRAIRGAVLDTWYRYPEPGDPGVRPSRHPFHELDNDHDAALLRLDRRPDGAPVRADRRQHRALAGRPPAAQPGPPRRVIGSAAGRRQNRTTGKRTGAISRWLRRRSRLLSAARNSWSRVK